MGDIRDGDGKVYNLTTVEATQTNKENVEVKEVTTRLLNFEEEPSAPSKNKGFTWVEIYSTVVAAFTFLSIGLLRSYTSPAISSMQKTGDIFNSTTIPESEVISWFASSPPMASFVGTVLSGPLLQFCGRKSTLLLLNLPFIAGWFLIGFSTNVGMLVTGRMLTGLAAGIATAGAQLYVSECVRPGLRGSLGFLPSMMLALGVLMGFASSSVISVEWDGLAFILAGVPTLGLLLTLPLPESPTWLVMKKKELEAEKSLSRLRNTEKQVCEEMEALQMAVMGKKGSTRNRKMSVISVASEKVISFSRKVKNFLSMLRRREIWLPAMIAVTLMMFQQFAAANVVIYFLTVILDRAVIRILPPGNPITNLNLTYNAESEAEAEAEAVILDHNLGSLIVASVQLLAFFVSLPLIDRMGRKVLLVASAVLMALPFSVLGYYFHCVKAIQGVPPPDSFVMTTSSWLPVTCLSVFIAAYSIGFGPIPFLIMSEIFPANARSYLCSVTSFANHFFLFIVIKTFPTLIECVGEEGTFWGYAGMITVSILFVVLVVPETKGKSLVEIEEGFKKKKSKNDFNI